MHFNTKDLTGQRFGRLTVVSITEMRTPRSHAVRWLCRCDCGNIKDIAGGDLRRHNTQSCGCLRLELSIKRKTTHGMKNTRLYRTWISMKNRCNNSLDKDYPNYGGRGIAVYSEWNNSIESFREWSINSGYDDTLTIDRKDVNGNYTPDNCRWISKEDQASNTRNTIYVSVNGDKIPLRTHLRDIGRFNDYTTIRYRIKRMGLTLEESLNMHIKGRTKTI